jgi:hypothetical protein
MNKLKPVLLLLFVFVAGMAVGVVGEHIIIRRVIREALEHPERVPAFIERRLDRRLGLDADQRAQMHDILAGTHQELKDLRQEFRPRFATIISEADGKISAILTPEQLERFEKLKAENPAIWQAGERKE